MNNNSKSIQRKKRTRAKLVGSAKKPRLSVFRSNKAVSAQLIDDSSHKTILTLTQKGLKAQEKTGKTEMSRVLGVEFAKKAKEKKITTVIFDRGPYAYHGRVKAFAEGLREGGLKF
jgi:large subunit ribosomal protein L18